MKLTRSQRLCLAFAVNHDGSIAKGPRRKAFAALEAAGLVRQCGYVYEDGGSLDREWPLFVPTDAGRELVKGGDR